jgi:hypothetical protein
MIKFGKQGTEPLLEALDGIVSDWIDAGLIVSDSPSTVVVKDDDEHITIILHDGGLDDY